MVSLSLAPALDLLFPPRCLHCGRTGAVLCSACLATVRAPEEPLCARCGRSLSAAGAQCASCAEGQGIVSLDALRAAAVYEGVAREATLALKYGGRRRYAEPLGDLLAAAIHRTGYAPELIVAVPLHERRRRERGYNQAELLARRSAARLGLPYRGNVIHRVRVTEPQTQLARAARRANVADAFALAPDAAHPLAGRRIALIDDVTTTGATLEAAAVALRAAQPAALWGFAVTRPDLRLDARDARERGARHAR